LQERASRGEGLRVGGGRRRRRRKKRARDEPSRGSRLARAFRFASARGCGKTGAARTGNRLHFNGSLRAKRKARRDYKHSRVSGCFRESQPARVEIYLIDRGGKKRRQKSPVDRSRTPPGWLVRSSDSFIHLLLRKSCTLQNARARASLRSPLPSRLAFYLWRKENSL